MGDSRARPTFSRCSTDGHVLVLAPHVVGCSASYTSSASEPSCIVARMLPGSERFSDVHIAWRLFFVIWVGETQAGKRSQTFVSISDSYLGVWCSLADTSLAPASSS